MTAAAACGGGQQGDSADGTVTLEMWDWWVDADPIAGVIDDLVEEYTDENPDVEIVRRAIPYSDYPDAVIQGSLARELPDILISDVVDTIVWGNLGVFRDISAEVEQWGQEDLYYEGRFDSVRGQEGEIFSLPNSSNTLGLYYDVDVLDEHDLDPPTTWEEFYDAAETISDGGQRAVIVAADPSLTGYQWLPWLWQAGGSVDDLASEAGVRALNVWRDMIETQAMTPDVVTYGHDDLREQFASGQVAMMVNGPWNLDALSADDVEIDWAVAPLPCDVECASQAGGENIGVSASTDHPEAAWSFIEWLQSRDVALDWTLDHNSIPHRTDLEGETVFVEKNPQMEAFLEQGAYMQAPPAEYIDVWPEVQEALSEAIHAVLVGGADTEQALADAAAQIEALGR
ncbi:sugar ABC transporter substrate-binding protein [Natronosporangium hydrolyticum]|uniref:Sugar ABC transporter substrate-binding protein n=1 Tax=Natronosporangium hydrolyticum TaxID=2811111 RepID=A0A895YIK5_9ACTN|nr:sugar ABC transporter substrate-binding protein [Natronosporangium hydrolyticum]QSB15359.1 sugar ABC transporter substrate-binding protein [Natronosporangium hydrolyticum]